MIRDSAEGEGLSIGDAIPIASLFYHVAKFNVFFQIQLEFGYFLLKDKV